MKNFEIAFLDRYIIGTGSVVTRDIPDGSLAVGNPARVIKKVD